MKTPDFDEIVGTEGTPEELAELRQVHNLLVSATPPPEAPAPRRRAPRPEPRFGRYGAALALGFAAIAATLTLGLTLGRTSDHDGALRSGVTVPMHGVGTASEASAMVTVGRQDASGNRTLRMTVHSLPALKKGWYTLYLIERGKPLVACGIFRTGPSGNAAVSMNAPTDLAEYDGWIVTAALPGHRGQVLLTT